MTLRALTLGAVAALLVSGLGPPGAQPSAGALRTPGPPSAVAASGGGWHSLVVARDGRVYGTGSNGHGQLTGSAEEKRALRLVRGLPDGVRATSAAAGDLHSLVVADTGRVYGTGSNWTGQLTGTGEKTSLTRLTGLPARVRATSAAAGDSHSLVVANDGRVYGAGDNGLGQLTGTATPKRTLTPLKGLPAGVRATAAAGGDSFSLVVADDGRVYGTGYNNSGELTGPAKVKRTLTALKGLPAGVRVIAAAAGGYHSLVVADDGLVYGTGWNYYGQLTGTADRLRTLTPLTGLPAGVRALWAAAGSVHSLVLADDGIVYGTGHNQYGQLTGASGRLRTLTPLTGLSAGVRATAAAAGAYFSLVLAEDGSVYGTGRNYNGQLTGTDHPKRTLTRFVWGITTTVRPRITGTARQGSTLTARHGTWWPVPTAYTYRWYRDGTAITGATGSTHRLVARDVGARLTVTVTAKHPGYQPTSSTSVRTPVISRR